MDKHMLTYYDYINAFHELLRVNPPSSSAQLLYHTLLMEYNSARWQSVELHRTNSYIGGLCSLGEKALINAKNELKQIGLIDFTAPKKKPTVYRLCTVENTVKTQVKGSLKEVKTQAKGQAKGRTYKEKDKEKDLRDITPIIPFDGKLAEKLCKWLRYKKERGQGYEPTGLESLFNSIQKNLESYGEQAVISVIDESLTNNWQGLFFDRIERRDKKQTQEIYQDSYDHDALEARIRRRLDDKQQG